MSAPKGSDQPDQGSSRLSLEPFHAVRFADLETLPRRTSPAYDLVDDADRLRLERSDPYNVVRLILPATAPGATLSRRYDRSAATLWKWRESGVLTVEPIPSVFVYEMSDGTDVTRGVLGTIPVLEPERGGVLPHEDTAAPIVEDRLALLRATQANLEPVVVAYEPSAANPLPDPGDSERPDLAMRCEDGVWHRVWRINDPARIDHFRRALRGRSAVIADGHHRYASYLAHRRERRDTYGPGPWDRALAYLVPTTGEGLRVRAIHRVVTGVEIDWAVRRAAAVFRIRSVDVPTTGFAELVRTLSHGALLLTDGNLTYLLDHADPASVTRAVGPGRSASWRSLDVVVAHRLLIQTLWEIPVDSPSVTVHPTVDRAVAGARRGGVAVLLRPPGASEVLDVARSGELMPRKSTLFVPKPRTGIVLRCFADDS